MKRNLTTTCHSSRPHRSISGRKNIIATLVTAAALSTGLSLAPMTAVAAPRPSGTVTPMNAVPNSRCAPIGHLYNGLCFGYTVDGKQIYNWLGTFDSPAGPGWGLDYIYGTSFGSGANSTGRPTRNAFGSDIGDDEMAALSRLTKMGQPGSISNTESAAMALIIREVMGDGSSPTGGQIIPGGLKVGGTVKRTDRLAIPDSVYRTAQDQWDAASTYRSPISVKITTDSKVIEHYEIAKFTVRVAYAGGENAAGVQVKLNYDMDGVSTLDGPSEVTTDENGEATFDASVSEAMPFDQPYWEANATVEAASSAPQVWLPSGWSGRADGQYPSSATRIIGAQKDDGFSGSAIGDIKQQ